MRALQKLEPPQQLRDRADSLAAEYISSGKSTRPWSHPEVRRVLMEETDEKCAYCEASFRAVSFGDIEHIAPKSKFPELVAEWTNLTLICSKCNQHKGSKHDPELLFVNPYRDSVEEHISFVGAVTYWVSDRGEYTINELNLNDASRVEARNREIKAVEGLLRLCETAQSEYSKQRLKELIELQSAKGQYTAAVLSYLALRKKDLRNAARTAIQTSAPVSD